ncbi:MAG: TonB-dependent receptor domain-containing protein, partial [Blastocatellia bacterium]
MDSISWVRGTHTLKFGIDYRRLSPHFNSPPYFQFNESYGAYAATGASLAAFVVANRPSTLFFHNVGSYVEDTWRTTPRLTLTFGVRWDIDPPPTVGQGLNFLAVTGFGNPATLALASPGTPLWSTTYGDFAPRLGFAYQLRQSATWETVLRGGYGIFYDLADQQVGDAVNALQYPFSVDNIIPGAQFPLPAVQQLPPAFTQPNPLTNLVAFDPHMKLPYSHEWNFAVEQSIGQNQALTVSDVGQVGRRLLLQEVILGPTNLIGPFGQENLVQNAANSNYNALQIQFQRRLSRGFQALASYTYSHSIDDGSGAAFDSPNLLAQNINPESNRGSSDFDIRHSFTSAFTYDIPSPKSAAALKSLFGGWALDSAFRARSASPVTVFYSNLALGPSVLQIRPDVVSGQPLYLMGQQYPGGRGLNSNAFTLPPIDPMTGIPARQGDLGRNSLTGFGATQWDVTVHRQFNLGDRFKLQFRSEFFNIFNHPNFGPPQPDLTKPFFGQATQMLGKSLG